MTRKIINHFPLQFHLRTESISFFIIVPAIIIFILTCFNISLNDTKLFLLLCVISFIITYTATYINNYIVVGPITKYFSKLKSDIPIDDLEYNYAFTRLLNLPYFHGIGSFFRWIFGLSLVTIPLTIFGNLTRVQIINFWLIAVINAPLGAIVYFLVTELLIQDIYGLGLFPRIVSTGNKLKLTTFSKLTASIMIIFLLPFMLLLTYFISFIANQNIDTSPVYLRITIIGLGGIVGAIVTSRILTKTISQKIRFITNLLSEVGNGNLEASPVPIIMQDDLSAINVSIYRMKENLREVISRQHRELQDLNISLEQKVVERTNELQVERDNIKQKSDLLEHEITLARSIQEQLIPPRKPNDYIFSLYKPMEDVGGDFFDFIFFENSRNIGIFLSDVSGHGVPAAFITSMIKTTLLQAGDRLSDPSGLLSYINDVLQNLTAGNFITAFYGIYSPDDRRLLFSNAGHPQPYIITGNSVTQLEGGKNTALAIMPGTVLARKNKLYINYYVQLQDNSKLLLYTDGFTETRPLNDGDVFFEYSSMNDILIEHTNLPSDAFIGALYAKLVEFRGVDSFEDDICLVCLDVK